jgi:hypothetical protein
MYFKNKNPSGFPKGQRRLDSCFSLPFGQNGINPITCGSGVDRSRVEGEDEKHF